MTFFAFLFLIRIVTCNNNYIWLYFFNKCPYLKRHFFFIKMDSMNLKMHSFIKSNTLFQVRRIPVYMKNASRQLKEVRDLETFRRLIITLLFHKPIILPK